MCYYLIPQNCRRNFSKQWKRGTTRTKPQVFFLYQKFVSWVRAPSNDAGPVFPDCNVSTYLCSVVPIIVISRGGWCSWLDDHVIASHAHTTNHLHCITSHKYYSVVLVDFMVLPKYCYCFFLTSRTNVQKLSHHLNTEKIFKARNDIPFLKRATPIGSDQNKSPWSDHHCYLYSSHRSVILTLLRLD